MYNLIVRILIIYVQMIKFAIGQGKSSDADWDFSEISEF